MEKRWVTKPQGDPEVVNRLAAELRINKLLVNLLVQRGVSTYEEARSFFRPSLDNLHDPFLMKDMDKAIERIGMALANKEHILVYGDYDVDGTTAVSLVYTFLKTYSGNIGYYIPDRYKEGYGISRQGIDWAKAEGYSLIIALDCGIKSIDKIDYASGLGIDSSSATITAPAVSCLQQWRYWTRNAATVSTRTKNYPVAVSVSN